MIKDDAGLLKDFRERGTTISKLEEPGSIWAKGSVQLRGWVYDPSRRPHPEVRLRIEGTLRTWRMPLRPDAKGQFIQTVPKAAFPVWIKPSRSWSLLGGGKLVSLASLDEAEPELTFERGAWITGHVEDAAGKRIR